MQQTRLEFEHFTILLHALIITIQTNLAGGGAGCLSIATKPYSPQKSFFFKKSIHLKQGNNATTTQGVSRK